MTPARDDLAVVIGAGIAGMLAASVLASEFAQVRIIDRDLFPDAPEPRKGTPQAQHIHTLLRRGLLAMDARFPGLSAELAQAGAEEIDWTADMLLFSRPGQAPRFAGDLKALTMSRSLLEFTIRQRLASYPNIQVVSGGEVTHLLADDNQRLITGVRLRYRDGALRGQEESLAAGLVVAASGRSSRVVDWLEDLGYPRPAVSKIQSFTGYATRMYERPAGFPKDWKVLLVRDLPPDGTKGGGIYPIEGDRWLVTLTGAGKEAPPTGEAEYEAFARNLIHPLLWESIAQAKPISKIHGYAHTDNQWQHFERMPRWPEGFIALGDAVCTFNPLYGQGMTVAALESEALQAWLRNGGGSFQKQVAQIVRTPWLIATKLDLKLPETVGSQPGRFEKLFQSYMDRVELLAYTDEQIFSVFMQINHMLKPPRVLFTPAILRKVLREPRQAGEGSSQPDYIAG